MGARRTHSFNIRFRETERDIVETAAKAVEKWPGEFVRDAAIRAAQRVLRAKPPTRGSS